MATVRIWRSTGGSGRRKVSGFAMIELILAITISAILAIYANQQLANQAQESIARGGGIWLKTVAGAMERHVFLNFPDLAAGNPVAGTAIALRPTIPELIALGRLNAGFPQGLPTRQVARIDITRTNCPGALCQVTSTVCTTTPIREGGAGITRFDLAFAMLDEQNGSGGQSRLGDGANIRGPALNVPNPNGNVEGIVCGSTMVDLGMFDSFVRIRDARNPDLQGALTVAGATTLNGGATVNGATTLNGATAVNNTLNVTGASTFQNNVTINGSATVGPCITLNGANGRGGFGCTNPNDLPPGYGGGVRTWDMVAGGTALVSSNPAGFTGANGNYALMTSGGGPGPAEIRTSGRTAGDRLTPIGSYVPGAACAAADEGSISRNASRTGLVVCQNSVWTPFQTRGVVGQVCAPNGVMGTSVAGLALYCQSGVWTLMADRFGRFAMTDTYLVYDNSRGLNPPIPIPVCPAGGSPKVYFNPQGVDGSSVTRTTNFRADITMRPGFYTILVDNSVNPGDPSGTPVAGYGLLTVGCFYN
jgi:prepilin-type N-terminal cleavage/methylation domain-containing protein